MKITATIALAAMLISGWQAQAQTKRALCVGIGQYQDLKWNTIHSDNDITAHIVPMLKANGFAPENIMSLTNSQATSANIKHELEMLRQQTRPNDIVLVYLSGHGQQVTDLDGDEAIINNDPTDRLDEAFVPWDAKMSDGQKADWKYMKQILDDYIYETMTDICKKAGPKGKVTLISDACYSGDSYRCQETDYNPAPKRGTNTIYRLANDPSFPKYKEGPKEPRFTVIMAGRNLIYEVDDGNGQYCGPITKFMKDYNGKDTASQIKDQVEANSNASPVIAGPINQPLF